MTKKIPEQVASVVEMAERVAAVNPEATAIIVSIPSNWKNAVPLREALDSLSGTKLLPPVICVKGDVAIANQGYGKAKAGLFLGINYLAELFQRPGDEMKAKLEGLLAEAQ